MSNSLFNDKAITSESEDSLFIKHRTVDKITALLSKKELSSLTVAITGEWGVGKTSCMNLLKKELEKSPNNKVISFEPLLEGRFEIVEILELFYLKLCSSIKEKHHKSNPILKKLLNSLAAISFAGSKFSIKGIIDIDVDNKYDRLIEIWQRDEVMDFPSQTKELNKFFINENLRIFIFIDELDRLPASHIANFLAFARILETFERLFCIVGFDYGQVVKSLIASSDNNKNNYERAKSSLDKLFQARFHILAVMSQVITLTDQFFL